jgi:hypothetical protein
MTSSLVSSKMNRLPIHLLLQIVEENEKSCFNLTFSLPKLGRFSLKNQSLIQERLLVEEEILDVYTSYKLNGRLHSVHDKPARSSRSCAEWFEHGLKHRENGPAFILYKKYQIWFIKGFETNREYLIEYPPSRDCQIIGGEMWFEEEN